MRRQIDIAADAGAERFRHGLQRGTEAADRLREVESQARQLEAAWATRFGDSSRSMKRIVTAALQAQQRLRALARA